MFIDSISGILQIPERCLVNRKITKAFFKRNFDLTSSEMSLLDDAAAYISVDWLASISPENANINIYKDERYLFEEIEIISVQTSATDFERNLPRIAELVQKYIPYPVLLCIFNSSSFVFNACDKEINQNDSSRRIIQKRYTTEPISKDDPAEAQSRFLKSLAFPGLDKTNLKTCYESYIQRIISLQATAVTGMFLLRTKSRSQADMENLEKIAALQRDIIALQNQAQKETQLSQRVQLNTQIQQKRKQVEMLVAKINSD